MVSTNLKTMFKEISIQEGFLDALLDKQEKWSQYTHNKLNVPRVSEILDTCIGKSYLQNWAATLGEDFEKEKHKILNTGTYAHILIEDYLTYGYIRDCNKEFNKPHYPEQSTQCYYNFLTWWHNMIEQNFKIDVLEIEKTVTCPLYGGTADLIARIKDPTGLVGNYVLDFKSSKSISIDYFYQTIMYKNAIEYNNSIESNLNSINPLQIDGVGIIRCDKFKNSYEYLIINQQKDPDFINSLNISVSNMITWYYNQINSAYQYKLVRNKYLKGDKWV